MNEIIGGWTDFSCDISPEEREIFQEAMKNFVGVKFEPVAVAKQLVAGTNYDFFCNSQIVAREESPNRPCMVRIFKPLEAPPIPEDIRAIPY